MLQTSTHLRRHRNLLNNRHSALYILLPISLGIVGSCGTGIGDLFVKRASVQLINETGFDVDPSIKFDDDTGVLAGWFPSQDFETGTLEPGEDPTFTFTCDELGTIFSDSPEQLLDHDVVAEADDSPLLERGDEFECGDTIKFVYTGDGSHFEVLAYVNGRLID